jgi:ubiquinone/menaquinone biosynthesis C-methylase UbiE
MQEVEIIKKKSRLQRDKEADCYDKSFSAYANAVEIPTTIKRLSLGRSDCVLDAGAGTGRLTKELVEKCMFVVAADFSFNSLKVCKVRCEIHKTARLYLVQADLCFLPFKDGFFNKIGCSQMLQDLPTPKDRLNALKEMKRVLKDKGIVVITTFNFPLTERLGFVKYAGKKEGFHHSGHSIYYYRFGYFEFKAFVSSVFTIRELCGIRNIPGKPIGEWFRKIGLVSLALFIDFFIEKTPLSILTGRFLLVKLEKGDE